MCTVTVEYARSGEYRLAMNRDESRARALADVVTERTGAAGRFWYPLDPQGGGSWTGINERGIGVALLNNYGAEATPAPRSRGGIVLLALECQTRDEVEQTLRRLPLADYGGFRLIVCFASDQVLYAESDRRTLRLEVFGAGVFFFSSSAFEEGAAVAERRRTFWRWGARSEGWAQDFHRSHRPTRGAFSVCMHRDDAHTVSFTQLAWGRQKSLAYDAGAPCGATVRTEILISA